MEFFIILIAILIIFLLAAVITSIIAIVFLVKSLTDEIDSKRRVQEDKKRALEIFRTDFINKYGLIPYHFELKRYQNEKNFIQQNHFELGFPYWSFSNTDGTKDCRYNHNSLIYQRSTIWLLDDYVLTCNNPLLMLKYISFLREEKGVHIQCDYYEKERGKKILKIKEEYNNLEAKEKIFKKYNYNPFEFEKYCASILEKEGYKTKVTSQTNDGGFDIMLQTQDGKNGLVECKCYQPNSSIGRPLIQKLVGANAIENADFLIFITTGKFSENALLYAKQTNVKCIDGDELLKIHQKYYSPMNNASRIVEYEEWKMTEEYLYPLFPPDVYQSMFNEPLKFVKEDNESQNKKF